MRSIQSTLKATLKASASHSGAQPFSKATFGWFYWPAIAWAIFIEAQAWDSQKI